MTSKTEGPQFWCLLKILVNKMREISKISRQVAPIVWLSTLKELSLPGVAASSESLVMERKDQSLNHNPSNTLLRNNWRC